jgi:hypothetical protein
MRNKLAHWTWGDSADISDALLLADPKDLIQNPPDSSRILVYRELDFRRIIRANERLAGFGLKFIFIMRDHPANAEDALYDMLCSEPEIQERLRRRV